MYLALDANDYVETKYSVENVEGKSYAPTPCKYKVNGDRKLMWAKELLTDVATKYQLMKKE